MADREITEKEKQELKNSEFKIIESDEERKQREIENIVNEALENECRKSNKYGDIVKVIKNVGIIDKNGLQYLNFDEVIKDLGAFAICKKSLILLGKTKNSILYGDFKRDLQFILNETGGMELKDMPYVGSVFEFLRKNSESKLDLIIREKNGKRKAFADIKHNKDTYSEVPIQDLDNLCETINNDDFAKEIKGKRFDMSK